MSLTLKEQTQCFQCIIAIIIMHKVNLRSIDLNLLVILQALLETRHVTEAANRLSMSQPAVSRALQRLRNTFGDQLLVRGPEGFELSRRAESIRMPLTRLLSGIDQLIIRPEFEPASAEGVVRFTGLDLDIYEPLPPLLRYLRQHAPGIRMDVIPQHQDSHEKHLISGRADFCITPQDLKQSGSQLYRAVLTECDYVCVMDPNNPLAAKRLTLTDYAAAVHGMISVSGFGLSQVDKLLQQQGCQRLVAARLASFLTIADFCRGSDLIFTITRTLAERIAGSHGLIIRELPTELPVTPLQFYLYWHARDHQDPMRSWVRRQLLELARSSRDQARPGATSR